MSAFASLIGQEPVIAQLTAAADAAAAAVRGEPGVGMSHAWLFTGPPGSGRSVAARAFAAALQCANGGCGTCHECHTAMSGAHADVEIVQPTGLSYSVAETRQLVARAALAPTRGAWQVTIIEDADRFTEQALNALLKALEEPPPRGVWLLCAPSTEDLLPTIRSRCRMVTLRIPPYDAVARYLEREGIPADTAAFAARAAQGHIGRARRLANDSQAAARRLDVLRVPFQVGQVVDCFKAAARLVDAAKAEAVAVSNALDEEEKDALREAMGDTGQRGVAKPRGMAGAMSDLERRQKSRATRTQRDALDRALVDLAAFYRDVLMVQLGATVDLVNPDLEAGLGQLATASTPEATLRRIESVLAAREAIEANVAPLIAVEAMAIGLHAG
ncbi:MAG: DNA polymerase III subunit delta' [Frankiaceae bacterium]|nr:DNA polymerase III subunit delta' [Frankiaceae bacterium]MBV9871308.1 DNA polymerase III subunit delta' [Frankiaceae bacterium]